jgi:hypothetical protein
MTAKRAISMTAVVSMLSLNLSGLALADSVSIDTTGPGSFNSATVNNSNTVTETNVNNVTVTNTNNQTATTGDATSALNTNGGGAVTGNASNNNSTSTTVAINNEFPASLVPGSGTGGVNPGGSGTGGSPVGASGGGSSLIAGSGGAGGAVGAGAGEALMLPQTGPNDAVDVSALRNQPLSATAPAPSIVKKTNNMSTMLLVAAAILSLLGAVGSAVYSIRQGRMA